MVGASGVLAAIAAVSAQASAPAPPQQPTYGPEAAWVRPIPIPRDVKASGAASDVLLMDSQARMEPGGASAFVEVAARINSPAGLQQTGNLVQVWDPATQALSIHRARILRGDKVIDLLANGHRFTVLRRETNLEAAVIDGQLTATLQPEGLQVGDILDFAFSLTRHEPALGDHAEGGAMLAHRGVIARLHASIAWPSTMAIHLWKTDDIPALAPKPVAGGAWREVSIDQADAVSPEPPAGAPVSAQLYGMVLASDFDGWRSVSAQVQPLFAKAATLAPDSPLNAEIARIRAAHPDAKARALAALELVENDTRYLAVVLNAGGLTPAPADLTWSRRFGDCKGKTALLLALLHGLGVASEPALANTAAGENLTHTLPELDAFDHVIVRAEIAGRTYWLDPTRIGDQNLDVIPIPNYRWVLPLRAGGAELQALEPSPPELPLVETVETVDLTAGLDKPARVHEEMILRGDGGWAFGMLLQRAAPTDRDRALKATFANTDSWVTPDKVGFAYDPQTMVARATLDGTGSPPFTSENQSAARYRDWAISASSIGYDPDFTRRGDYHRDAPYVVAYPAYTRGAVDVRLPNGGKGFEAVNAEGVARTVAGVQYARSAAVVGDRFTMIASAHAVAQSFPASQATADADALRSLADYDVSLRADTAPPTGTGPSPAPQTPEAAFYDKDYAASEAMFSREIAAHPSALLYYDRGAARARQGETAPAKADFEAALRLDPGHANASYALGRYALNEGRGAEADRRFTQAFHASGEAGRMAAMIAAAYSNAKMFERADPYVRRAAAADTDLRHRAAYLNSHCWVRAMAGRDLRTALDFCDESLATSPGQAAVLDSRGLVELRLSAPGKAVKDYTDALAKAPGQAGSRYGRGLAEHRLGMMDAAQRDMADALAADPNVKAAYDSYGVKD